MTSHYVWELGIDWDAVEEGTRSFLRQGFVRQLESGLAMGSPVGLYFGDVITFRIFDTTAQPAGLTVVSPLTIRSRAAVVGQSTGTAFDSDRPVISCEGSMRQSEAFLGEYPCWDAAPVSIAAAGRFLLTFEVKASDGAVERTFVVDPEMVVGADGSGGGNA